MNCKRYYKLSHLHSCTQTCLVSFQLQNCLRGSTMAVSLSFYQTHFISIRQVGVYADNASERENYFTIRNQTKPLLLQLVKLGRPVRGSSFSTCSQDHLCRLVEQCFSSNHQCQSTEGNKSTNPNQWPGLILSSSTARLLMEWVLFPLNQLSDTSNVRLSNLHRLYGDTSCLSHTMNQTQLHSPPVTSHIASRAVSLADGTKLDIWSLGGVAGRRRTIPKTLWSQRNGSFVSSLPGAAFVIGRFSCTQQTHITQWC